MQRDRGRALVSAHAGAGTAAILGLDHYEKAASTGADFIEIDVRQTADGVLVAHHEPTVQNHELNKLEWIDLSTLATKLPRVVDVIELVKGRARLHVDIKDSDVEQSLLALLGSELDADAFVLTSLDDEVIVSVKALWPQVCAGLSLGVDGPPAVLRTRLSELRPLRRLERCGADFLAAHHHLARFGVLRQAAAHDIPVLVWTVNDKAGLLRFLNDERATGVITDVPGLAVPLARTQAAVRE